MNQGFRAISPCWFFLVAVDVVCLGRDFMGQGAPPISQQLKQLVDVEAQPKLLGWVVLGDQWLGDDSTTWIQQNWFKILV